MSSLRRGMLKKVDLGDCIFLNKNMQTKRNKLGYEMMLPGRLEIFMILLALRPAFWQKQGLPLGKKSICFSSDIL